MYPCLNIWGLKGPYRPSRSRERARTRRACARERAWVKQWWIRPGWWNSRWWSRCWSRCWTWSKRRRTLSTKRWLGWSTGSRSNTLSTTRRKSRSRGIFLRATSRTVTVIIAFPRPNNTSDDSYSGNDKQGDSDSDESFLGVINLKWSLFFLGPGNKIGSSLSSLLWVNKTSSYCRDYYY